MRKYLYLSLLPEALIASMLSPEEFGNYLAIGAKKITRGQAIFFEVDMNPIDLEIDMKEIETKCVPHPDGSPKRSLYLSIYRALEKIPLNKLKNLYLTTDDGRVLGLEKKPFEGNYNDLKRKLRLYQYICPTSSQVASLLNPKEFAEYMSSPNNRIRLPKFVFAEMFIGELEDDPLNGSVDDLPYLNIEHLRDCLNLLLENPMKYTKTVARYFYQDLPYRMIKTGFFAADEKNLIYYPMPSKEELLDKYYAWWRSALTIAYK